MIQGTTDKYQSPGEDGWRTWCNGLIIMMAEQATRITDNKVRWRAFIHEVVCPHAEEGKDKTR